MEMSCSEKIFSILSEITWETMSEQVIKKAKDCVADYMSVLLRGSEMEIGQGILAALGGEVSALSAEDLGLWLGSSARVLDMDDGHRTAFGHPGVPIISAALAAIRIGRKAPDGKRFLTGICRAYELYAYLGRTVNPTAHLGRGFDTTSLCGTAAAAVAAGTAAGYSDQVIFHAANMALMHSGGLIHSFEDGSAPKYLCAGWAVMIAIKCLRLAEAGLKGPLRGIEGLHGFCQAHSDDPHLDVRDEPKLNWEIMTVYFKRYSCVRRIHATLDAADKLIKENRISWQDIDHIDVLSNYNMVPLNKYTVPHVVVAQSSTPFCLALFLVHGSVTLESMTTYFQDEAVRDLMPRIKIVEVESFSEQLRKDPGMWGSAEVVIYDRAGKSYRHRMDVAYGDPDLPFPAEFLREKLFSMMEPTGYAEKKEALWSAICSLDTMADVRKELLEILF